MTLLQKENKRLQKLAEPSGSTEEPSSSKADSETTSQSQEANVLKNTSTVLAEVNNSEEDSQYKSDSTDDIVNDKKGEGDVTTETHNMDTVKEGNQVAIQDDNTADIANTAGPTENGEETSSADVTPII